jgi:NAD(P)-dependent dehydrogenase (short-subunit alcohol dehydrogenase family)
MRLQGRVAIVSGAGRGLGRAHALFLAAQGASVVVNDLGGSVSGQGKDETYAQRVVEEIRAAGGHAEASGHDVSDWTQANELIDLAVTTFGRLDVLVNNAGILRDRTLANMSEEEWDAVIRVHLKGHAAPTRHAVAYWRAQSKAGQEVKASVIHTSSVAAFTGNFGQANYSAAKAAVLGLSKVVALEGSQIGVRSNVVSPGARTRISESTSAVQSTTRTIPEGEFDRRAPENVSPLIGWLAERNCPANAQVFHIAGNKVVISSMPPIIHKLETQGRWTLEELDRQVPARLVQQVAIEEWF